MFDFSHLWIILFTVTIALIVWYIRELRFRQKLPPGPRGYPILGNFGQIKFTDILNEFKQMRMKYGDIFSCRIFNQTVVVINGITKIKDLLVKGAESLSRPGELMECNPNNLGIVSSSGELWKEHRSFVLKTLREFGFGKRSLETLIKKEVSIFLQELRNTEGNSFSSKEFLTPSIANVIVSITFGDCFEHSDKRILRLIDFIDSNVSDTFRFAAVFIPFASRIPGDPFKTRLREKQIANVRKFLREIIEEHRKTLNENNARDFIDCYLIMQKTKENQENTFTDDQLLMTLNDLFVAGTETTATTLKWAILYLIIHPEIQNKMVQEINQVVGSSQSPSLMHKPSLPFCEAVILEVQRIGNIVPLGVPYSAKDDIYYNGLLIPTGAIVIANLTSVGMDENIFPDHEKFDPERFLDKEGNICGQHKIIPFSTGRRVCLGESLAKQELFLFLVSLVQRFELLPEDPGNLPSTKGIHGATYSPIPFRLRAIARD